MSVNGLTSAQAQVLLKEHGPNSLPDHNQVRPVTILLRQFKSILIAVLLLAALISYLIGDSLDSILILIIILLNALFGFFQEFRAEKAIKALRNMVVNQSLVIRDGTEQLLEARYLVPGDLIIIQEGDRVPADCQLVEAVSLSADEASLTGESIPVTKNASGEEDGLYLGTTVVHGHGKARVLATGPNTRFGKIASLLKNIEEEPTPLQIQLGSLSKYLLVTVVIATTAIFIIGFTAGRELTEMLLTSVSLAVSVVPEGLPAVVTITLAIGVQRMARRHAIIRRLNAIETLGATNVICTDKTGTLTKNEMTVTHIWTDYQLQSRGGIKVDDAVEKLLTVGILANTAVAVSNTDNNQLEILGDKTEGSLLSLAEDLGFSVEDIRQKIPLSQEFPFDSSIKTMAVVTGEKNKSKVYVKGAPEIILASSHFILSAGRKKVLSAEDKENILHDLENQARQGQRMLAFGYKDTSEKITSHQQAQKDLIFLGFVGITDPLRPEIRSAVHLAREAGIRTIMITGDNKLTATSIAQEAGILSKDELVLTHDDLTNLTDSELSDLLPKTTVFARANPEDKVKIVRLLQRQGYVVALTGDGVNDAPALKQANVGVAMGITGTDVAKEAGDIVLSDDNYASLIATVEEGRVIYDNILKSLKFLLSSNFSELVVIIVAVVAAIPLPLTPLQILWINLVTDSLPAIALATDPKDPLIMKRLPRDKTIGIIKLLDPFWLVKTGALVATITLVVFLFFYSVGGLTLGRTMAFNVIIITQLLIALAVRKGHPWHTNWQLLLTIGFIILLQIILLFNGTLSRIFGIGFN